MPPVEYEPFWEEERLPPWFRKVPPMEMPPWFQEPVLASSFEVLSKGQFPKAGVGEVVVIGRCEKGRRLCSFVE